MTSAPPSPDLPQRPRRSRRAGRRRRLAAVVAGGGVAVVLVAAMVTPADASPGRGRPWWFPWGHHRTVATVTAGGATPTRTPAGTTTGTGSAVPSTASTASTGSAPTAASTAATTAATTAPTTAPVSTSSPGTATGAPAGGACARKASSTPVTRVTSVSVGSVVSFAAQGDTDALPAAIAAAPSGGSWLAWLGTDQKVHLGLLDCDDQLTGTPTTFPAVDLVDVKADAGGGVLLLTRSGPQGGGTLCGGTSSPTRTMVMVRFDTSGRQVWERQVTNLSSSLGGYDPGARFVWWYNHHGELAFDGTNYAAYFGVAITVKNGNCVDIHEGDRMQVVNAATGALVSGHDSFEVGCSHSWDTHLVWDGRTGHFVMTCATDNQCRIARPAPYRTVAAGTCDGTLFGGDLVRAATAGYWTAWSQGDQVRLEHFSTGASDRTVTTAGRVRHSHLAGYGSGRMLLAWKSGSSLAAQVYDSGTGAAVGGQFSIAVPDHPYVGFAEYADGSVAAPFAGGTGGTLRIARVMPTA